MPELVNYCSVIMGNLWSVESLLGIESPVKSSEGKSKEELTNAAGKSMLQIHKQFPQAASFAYTFRLEKEYWAILQHGKERAISKQYALKKVVDRAGSGDCFMGGLIYGLFHKHPPLKVIDFAAAAAVGKLAETGDSTSQTIDDVKKIMNT